MSPDRTSSVAAHQPHPENPVTSAYYADEQVTLLIGDALDVLREMPGESVDCVVTSPPYFGLRSYTPDLLVRRSDLTRDERQRFLHEMNKLGLLRNPERYSRDEIPAELMDLFQPAEYGAEKTPAQYVETMRQVFAEAKRVLAKDGTCWINLGDSYSGSWGNQGHKDGRDDLHIGVRGRGALPKGSGTGSRKLGEPGPKNLYGIPWRVAFALQDDGWNLRNEVVWHKTNAMPESVADRLATRHEKLFLFTRSERYWFDLDAIREPQKTAGQRHEGRSCGSGEGWPSEWSAKTRALNPKGGNPGDVWSIATRPFPEAHFATFPIDLPVRCIKAGCKPGGVVLDPFSGSGTTGEAARRLGRKYVGIDLSAAYHDLAVKRFQQGVLDADEPRTESAPTYRQRLLTTRPDLADQNPSLFDLLAAGGEEVGSA